MEPDVVRALVDGGGNVKLVDREGKTARQIAEKVKSGVNDYDSNRSMDEILSLLRQAVFEKLGDRRRP